MLPLLEVLAVVFLLSTIYYVVSSSRKATKREKRQEEQLETLANSLTVMGDQFSNLEKRLTNVETIVTDSKFIDPPTNGREAIDIKSELSELKSIIKNLQK
jgi:septal ring factor EnvC (AmiA/AmiB activator)